MGLVLILDDILEVTMGNRGNSIDQRIGINRGWPLGSSGQSVADGLNNNFRLISVLLQASVKSASINFVSKSVAIDGDTYIVPQTATQDWMAHKGEIAQYDFTLDDWFYIEPKVGFSIYVVDINKQWVYTTAGWKTVKFED